MPPRHGGRRRTGRLRAFAVALCVSALMGLSGCGGSTPQPPPSGDPPGNPPGNPPGTDPGAVQVSGSERIAWDQLGDVSTLRFVAYVDGQRTPLDRATCAASPAGPQGTVCLSPLPSLTNGLHTIELAAVSNVTQLESARSVGLRLQKVAGITAGTSTIALVPPVEGRASRAVDNTLRTGDGSTFDVRIVASGLDATTQMAWAPDRRLFVADRGGRVHVLPSSEDLRAEPTLALDSGALLDPAPEGGLGLALHPEFARNHLVYVAYVTRDRREQPLLRVVRLREVGGTLGEPAVLFEEGLLRGPSDGPRLAFGPDGRLYIALTAGVEPPGGGGPDTGESASTGAILRIDDDGRTTGESPVFSYGTARPVAFAFVPGTQDLWAVLSGAGDRATLGRIGAGRDFEEPPAPAGHRRLALGPAHTPGGLLFYRPRAGGPATAFVALPDSERLLRVSLGEPARTDVLLRDAVGRIGDIVQGDAGVLFIATRNRDGRGNVRDDDDLVVRLTPRKEGR